MIRRVARVRASALAVLALLAALALAAGCGDESDSIEDPPTMRRTTGGADIVPAANKAPAGTALVTDPESCMRHLACCESLLRVPGSGGQPRSCFEVPSWRTQGSEGLRQCAMGTQRVANSLRARGLDVPAECASP